VRLSVPRAPLLPRRNSCNRKGTLSRLSKENVSWDLVNERLDYLPLPIRTSRSQRKMTRPCLRIRMFPLTHLVASARKRFALRRDGKNRMLQWCKRWQRQHAGYKCRERQLPSSRMLLWRKMMMMMSWKHTRRPIPIRNQIVHLFRNPSIYFPMPLQNRRIWAQQWRGIRCGRFTTSYPRFRMHPPRPPRWTLQRTTRRHMRGKLLWLSKRRRKMKGRKKKKSWRRPPL
jgi:hypothetical protein